MRRRWTALCAAAALILAVGVLPAQGADASFPDVAADAWYAPAVWFNATYDLMLGQGDGKFHPDDVATRAMLCTVLYRRAGMPGVSMGPTFQDVPLTGWYYGAVAWASEHGLVNGYSEEEFGSFDPVTREQIATILWRQAGAPVIDETPPFPDWHQVSEFARDGVIWAWYTGLMGGKSDGNFDPQGQTTRGEMAMILYRQGTGTTAPGAPNG